MRRGARSGYTVNELIGTAKAFTKWAVTTRRIPTDPLACVRKLEARKLENTRLRRALTPTEVSNLLDAARSRPERELRLIRVGPRKGELSGRVSVRALAAARRTGEERVVVYLLALWTGLRRAELGQLEWRDVELDVLPPRLLLRSETTKSKRGDTIALHPEIADALRTFRPDDSDPDDLVVPAVPNMNVVKADLKFAGIEFQTPAGRADLHAMRKSLATMLATSGVGQRIAQHHMRHTDPRLTACTYTDESLLPTAATISALPWVGSAKAG